MAMQERPADSSFILHGVANTKKRRLTLAQASALIKPVIYQRCGLRP
jgi:hypothetical protein